MERIGWALPKSLIDRFRTICDGEGQCSSHVVEALMKDFCNEYDELRKANATEKAGSTGET